MEGKNNTASDTSVRIYNQATSSFLECAPGTSLKELLDSGSDTGCERKVLAAYVNNELKELGYRFYQDAYVRFVDILHPDGRRVYTRSLCMVAQKVISELFPDCILHFSYTLPDGLYGELRYRMSDAEHPGGVSRPDLMKLAEVRAQMQKLIAADLPLLKRKMPNPEAEKLFAGRGQTDKASLIHNMERWFVTVYELDGYVDTFYGPLLYSTGEIRMFDIVPYGDGFCLQYPRFQNPKSLFKYRHRSKLAEVFSESARWNAIQRVSCITSVNGLIRGGGTRRMVALAESLHERKYAEVADKIASRKGVKLVLISGPSSSGKTTTSMRIALQCRVIGLNPIVIGMDDYFVDRVNSPKDEKGEHDFESPHALNLELLSTQMNALFSGEEVELPRYDFIKGISVPSGRKVRMSPNDIVIMEGIHALNPLITEKMDSGCIFRIFASALTSLCVDENNCISTTDSRLLRRILRDYRTRGYSPEKTIERWPSVRSGEEKHIFPYQENADVMFNTTLVYELAVLKYYVDPLLRRIGPTSDAHSEAVRLLKFLSYIEAVTPEEGFCIPSTSVIREFIGGSSFEY